jgi:hypothetical protein
LDNRLQAGKVLSGGNRHQGSTVDKDERSLLEAMLHRLQLIRQENEQQTAILRQLCQAIENVGLEIGRMANGLEPASVPKRR